MGVEFTELATDIDETQQPGEQPVQMVERLSRAKAAAALKQLNTGEEAGLAILASDTIVVQGGKIFGKPKDRQDAYRIWNSLSDSQHQVMTAVCLLVHDKIRTRTVTTDVHFAAITESQMQRYWASGEPRDKAGAYAIQGLASAWVKLVNGSYSNVVGLPLREVNQLLAEIGLNWL